MVESTSFTLPKTMPVNKRISRVSKQISKWIESLDKPFNAEADALHLTEYEKNGEKYIYHYTIARNAKSPKKMW